jgi:hypothetical protein
MDAACIAETLVLTCHATAQWNNLEYQRLNLYLRVNLKSYGNGQPVFEIVLSRENDDNWKKNNPNFICRF